MYVHASVFHATGCLRMICTVPLMGAHTGSHFTRQPSLPPPPLKSHTHTHLLGSIARPAILNPFREPSSPQHLLPKCEPGDLPPFTPRPRRGQTSENWHCNVLLFHLCCQCFVVKVLLHLFKNTCFCLHRNIEWSLHWYVGSFEELLYRTAKRKAKPARPNPAAAIIALLMVLFWSESGPCLLKN